ncbi:hypothetical protein [Haliangium sp.]|uniref:hypothetical protein n=1 Tax=Haliangium sp. TaxID=2663208 RepID=UPI003D0F2D20
MSDKSSRACRACLRFGWAAIATFLLLGLILELLHLIKAPFYVEALLRRELWTLAHAHGTLLGLVNVAFAATGTRCLERETARMQVSWLLRAGALLVPAGFFLGGIGNAEGDPSLLIALVPVGALLLIVATAQCARGAVRARIQAGDDPAPAKAADNEADAPNERRGKKSRGKGRRS